MPNHKIKVGVFGAGRGMSMIRIMARHPDAELVAICDKYEPLLAKCGQAVKDTGSRIACYTDFERFFEHEMDAVVLANYAHEHSPYAVRLLRSGRHVISELMAVETPAQAVELVEAVEHSGKVYAYAANTCYYPAVLEMKRLFAAGEIGEFLHGEGEYIHDCEEVWHQLTYGERHHWRNTICYVNYYCTHSLGPILTITGTRPVNVVGFETPNAPFMANVGYTGGTSGVMMLQMSNDAIVKCLQGNLRREPSLHWFSVAGTKGVAESDRWDDDLLHVFRRRAEHTDYQTSYKPKFRYRTDLSRSVVAHGGSDFYTMHYFLENILGRADGAESIDVYQALDMTLPGILAHRSILRGNIPVDVPDFRDRTVREAYRDDHFCANPAIAGANAAPMSSFGNIEVPESVFVAQKAKWNASRLRPGVGEE